jgi:dephospho-CoA kinase
MGKLSPEESEPVICGKKANRGGFHLVTKLRLVTPCHEAPLPVAQPTIASHFPIPPAPIVIIIGVIGGIGSGKSAVCRWIADRDPSIRVIDADRDGHRVLEIPAVKDALREAFGNDIFGPEGVTRSAVAARVFGDSPDQQAARRRLQAIVHPAIANLREEQLAGLSSSGVRAVLIDAALLLEANWQDRCDAIVFVDVPRNQRLERVRERGWTDEELARREASQWPLNIKKAAANFVVDNSRTLDNAGTQLYEYIQRLIASAAK